MGITAIWIPPACKGGDNTDTGYGIYGLPTLTPHFRNCADLLDLWDLGEFDQKGTVLTKYGPFDDLIILLSVAKQNGMFMYYDAVLNHKAWADAQEQCQGIQVDWNGITNYWNLLT